MPFVVYGQTDEEQTAVAASRYGIEEAGDLVFFRGKTEVGRVKDTDWTKVLPLSKADFAMLHLKVEPHADDEP